MSCAVCQKHWEYFLDVYNPNPHVVWIFGTIAYITIVAVIISGSFMFMDITGVPKRLRKYKLQPGTNEPLTWTQLKKLLKTAFVNLILVGIPALSVFHGITVALGRSVDLRTLPSLLEILYTIPIAMVSSETVFYYSHRMLHSKILYKTVHKKHHEWTAPVSLAAVYAHPVEHIVSNMAPFYAPVMLVRTHIITAWIWATIVLMGTLHDHSGYHLPYLWGTPDFHDFHHQKFNQCYGAIGILDWLHGTDVQFRRYKAKQRAALQDSDK
ncbi:fatty acid hydroxylase domain-containing protein 2 isoform X2 [Aedes aegypti]|uniref:Fatty acid hydroxylase domain-containing protein n=3 Tax=Aedes aegypti TaxID=7159 RepID=A0A6R5I1G6_AEDAE|nr:fatty acid hydroxylase domain-containing protein 2 isoform X2 [Aedes aegypti]XP_021712208.1 fatty acid hydroxylase domain-containing protein 2 isoform X2 [Aedes aegypti]XP_021712215.1 fatty acid hydroxylase domain-containing protein 2 isoform X2 [Aedes aegypti]